MLFIFIFKISLKFILTPLDSRVYGNWSDNSTLPQVQWKHQLVNNITVLDPFTKTWTHAQWVPLSYIISAFSWVSPAGSVQLSRLACLILQLKCPTLLHRHPCLNETRFQNFLLKWNVMVETTSIISKTYLRATHPWFLLGGQMSHTTHDWTAVQGWSPSKVQIWFSVLGPTVHLESTSPIFSISSFCFQAEMAQFKFILLTLLFFYFTINTSPSQLSQLLLPAPL